MSHRKSDLGIPRTRKSAKVVLARTHYSNIAHPTPISHHIVRSKSPRRDFSFQINFLHREQCHAKHRETKRETDLGFLAPTNFRQGLIRIDPLPPVQSVGGGPTILERPPSPPRAAARAPRPPSAIDRRAF